jgi:endo-1,4-beta-xylanase
MNRFAAFALAIGLTFSGFAPPAVAETLRELAEARGISIGAAVAVGPFRSEPAYIDTLKREFDMMVAENAFKWSEIHRYRDKLNFIQTDALVAFAEANGMKVRGHTLVWHNQNPPWLEAAATNRDEAIAILKDHISQVVGHYKGRVTAWDVVNEAIDDSTGELRDTIWLRIIGPDYIAMAFRFAHEADPDAKLYYNDYNIEDTNRKSDAVYALVKQLLADGVPIDGVGWQMHLVNGQPIGNGFRENGQRLAELGLEISFTELDVRMPVPPSSLDLRFQADTYADVTRLCLDLPNCKAILTWGFTDRHSWIPGFFSGYGAALPFDEDYTPKPAYEAIAAALAQK